MPIIRPCAQPGCPHAAGERSSRCAQHRQVAEKVRGSKEQRGYGKLHKKIRAAYQQRMDEGKRYRCWRCRRPINPLRWTLGHCDNNRNVYHGPECPSCNYATQGRAGRPCPHPSHR